MYKLCFQPLRNVTNMTSMHKKMYGSWQLANQLLPGAPQGEGFMHEAAKRRVMIQFGRSIAWTHFPLIAPCHVRCGPGWHRG